MPSGADLPPSHIIDAAVELGEELESFPPRDGNNYADASGGIPQGSSMSPVLMNIYLHNSDREMMGRGMPLRYARHADDSPTAPLPGQWQ